MTKPLCAGGCTKVCAAGSPEKCLNNIPATQSKKAAIAIDAWKLPIFERHLTQSGYTYTKGPGLSCETLMLRVDTKNVEALSVVIRAANDEAARTGKPKQPTLKITTTDGEGNFTRSDHNADKL